MFNPTKYESEEDREKERTFMSKIDSSFNCKSHKLPIHWEFDLLIARGGQGVACGEMKHRNHNADKYPTLIMSERKLKKMLKFALYFDVKPLLFIRYLDKDVFAKVPKALDGLDKECLLARNHYWDERDREWVVYLPLNGFREF